MWREEVARDIEHRAAPHEAWPIRDRLSRNPVGGRSCAPSISPIAAASGFPASTTIADVRARLKGAPAVSAIETGAGTSCGARVTGCGVGTDAGRQAALVNATVNTTTPTRPRSDPITFITPASLTKGCSALSPSFTQLEPE